MFDTIADSFKYLTTNFKGLVTLGQILAGLTVAIHISLLLFKNFTKSGKVLSTEMGGGGLTPFEILKPLAVLLLIGLINPIFSSIEDVSYMLMETSTADFRQATTENLQEIIEENELLKENKSSFRKGVDAIHDFLLTTQSALSNFIFGSLFRGLLMLIEVLIIPVWFIKRYFHLVVFKLFSPVILALSIFDATKSWALNMFKLFGRAAFAIIPLYFVQVVCDHLLVTMPHIFLELSRMAGISKGGVYNLVLVFIIFAKSKLCKESFSLMDKIMP